MKFLHNLAVLGILGTVALFLTNPGPDAFSAFLSKYVQAELADDSPGETELGKAFRKGLGQIAGAAGGQLAEREDHSLWSFYTLRMGENKHVFLGIGGQFIKIESTVLQPG